MKRRNNLLLVTSLALVCGLIFATIPFIQSMNPTDAARDRAKVIVKLSELPENRPMEFDYRSNRAFVVKNHTLTVFLMPYWNQSYRLPDPTWERAFVPCNTFIADEEGFSCEDPSLGRDSNEQATWDLAGNNKGVWMPDLQKSNFIIEGGYLILSPENQ